MNEARGNRAWLLANRANTVSVAQGRGESIDTLLYYQSQLEAELEEVKQRIAQAARGNT